MKKNLKVSSGLLSLCKNVGAVTATATDSFCLLFFYEPKKPEGMKNIPLGKLL
jgi:cyclic lactone autoinducer peptide